MPSSRDEDAPAKIADENAVKPEGWLDDEPEYVADPDAEKPEDWYVYYVLCDRCLGSGFDKYKNNWFIVVC